MTTILDLITRSLRLINVSSEGEPLSSGQVSDALQALNSMLDAWNTEEGMGYTTTIKKYALVTGQQSYTIGIGGNINVARPVGIAEATLTLGTSPSPIDYPLQILNDEEWAGIALKAITTNIPRGLYYDHDFPLGKIYLWPTPGASAYLNLFMWGQVGNYELDDTVALPPGWDRAIVTNLAVECAPEYGKEASQTVMMLAMRSKAMVKLSNRRPRMLVCDPVLLGPPPLGYGLPDFIAGR